MDQSAGTPEDRSETQLSSRPSRGKSSPAPSPTVSAANGTCLTAPDQEPSSISPRNPDPSRRKRPLSQGSDTLEGIRWRQVQQVVSHRRSGGDRVRLLHQRQQAPRGVLCLDDSRRQVSSFGLLTQSHGSQEVSPSPSERRRFF